MSSKLVVVESPAKAKTIRSFLGPGYRVVASMGHVRDLPRKKLGVDVDHGFRAHWVIAPRKRDVVKRLRDAADKSSAVYLATDLDREGEAIGWHVLKLLKLPKSHPVHRITFHEITPAALRSAFEKAGQLNSDLVEAQQTRRLLDRLVGYQISPFLWRRIKGARALSAGRVQTVALRLVVDREREIEAFEPEEYWTIEALLAQRIPDPIPFLAQLYRIGREKPDLKNRDDAQQIIDALEGALYWVQSVKTQRKEQRPPPPFTTSTLQQAASRALRFGPQLTMKVAQQLYEGVRVGDEGHVGLITYMRTDSTYVAPEAQAAARKVIIQYFGEEYLPPRPPMYRTKVKSAQEAHEAIRPTDANRTPKQVRPFLDAKQDALYTLIWRRFVASQMANAIYKVTTALIPTARDSREQRLPYLFRARGRERLFDGFLKVYEEKLDVGEEAEAEKPLPSLREGEDLDLLELIPTQHWTKPPPRYTEASLIKELERRGIGRPSTFAGMVNLIQHRKYVQREKRVLIPTALGFTVCDLLVEFFPDLFDYDFTAQLEQTLDEIANGRQQRLSTLQMFWADLEPALDRAKEEMPTVTVELSKARGAKRPKSEPTGEACPECGGALVTRRGRFGDFIGCANYPRCKYTQRAQAQASATCPKCGGDLIEKEGRHGRFLGCTGYPVCTFTRNISKEPTQAPDSSPRTDEISPAS
jgi:DNA topoisomerase-1